MRPFRLGAVVALCLMASTVRAQVQPSSAPGVGLLQMVTSAIARHPTDLLQQQQVAIATGTLQAAEGQFDPLLSTSVKRQRTNQPLLLSQQNPIADTALQNLTVYSVGLQKQFRTGLTITPSVGMSRTDLNLSQPAYGQSSEAVTVTQPLARGRGREAVTSGVQSAQASLAANEQAYRYTASSVAGTCAAAYWSYVAAYQVVGVAQAAVARSRQLLADVQQLVAADQQPAADLKQLQAELASRTVQALIAQQQLVAARYQLGMAAGLDATEMAALPTPADDFPVPSAGLSLSDEALLREAMAQRADLRAAREQIRSAQETVVAAKDATRPQINLSATFGFAGLDQGAGVDQYFRPLFNQLTGGNVTVALNYQWPIANNVAFGQLAQSQAAADSASIREQDAERTVASQVAVAVSGVRLAISQVEAATQEATLYRSAVDDERTKMQLGLSTVLDLIVTEDRLTQAEVDAITAKATYAQAVVQLRFSTGTILTSAPAPQVSDATLLTLP
ncbi:MAG TPA: TolC family protein [Vicinamibacterales bacterium]